MKKLHVNLDRDAEAAWNSVLLHPNFRRMPQQGVIEVLCATYLRVNAGDCGSENSAPSTSKTTTGERTQEELDRELAEEMSGTLS